VSLAPSPAELLHLAVALGVVCAAAAAGGVLARTLGQPRVIGEIAAGIALGPSLLGAVAPGASAAVFPPEIRDELALLAAVGVVLFMFSVGLELDLGGLARGRAAIAVTHANVLVVALLGVPTALVVFPAFAGADTSTVTFTAFLCVALSVTALPVLARILQEPSVSVRPLAGLALASAAVTDAVAWCFLVVVAALATAASPLGGAQAFVLAVALAVGALGLVRPLLAAGLRRLGSNGATGPIALAVALAVVASLALTADAIGIHVIVGAFLAGLVMRGQRPLFGRGYAPLARANDVVLLPVFFASVGLHMDLLGFVTDPGLIAAGLLVLAVAVCGKVGGVAVAARANGLPWRESVAVGILLNTRGLTEIVVLQTGLQLGLLTRDGFGILVVVALVTTMMTLPALRAVGFRSAPRRAEGRPAPARAPRPLPRGERPNLTERRA
jgi:Kef-type K+ transport system membrane component KefB